MGILLATIIARLLTHVWYEPFCLFKFFQESVRTYFGKQLVYHIIFAICAIATYKVASIVNLSISILNLLVKGVICLIIPNVLIVVVFSRSEEYREGIRLLAGGRFSKIIKI